MLQNNSSLNADTTGELNFEGQSQGETRSPELSSSKLNSPAHSLQEHCSTENSPGEQCSPPQTAESLPVEESLISKANLFRQFRALRSLYESGADFVSFDTETTGLHGEKDFLLELGAVKFSQSKPYSPQCEAQAFNMLIKPPVSIPSYITKINNIDDEMVKDAPNAKEVLAQFVHFIDKKTVLIAHNASFDIKFVNAALARADMPQLKNTVIDTLSLARWAYPKLAFEAEKGQYKLQSLAKRFNIEVQNAHRAQDDARVCMEVFFRILADTESIQTKEIK